MTNDYKETFEQMKIAGSLAADTLDEITSYIKPGITTNKIDKISTGSKTDKFGIDFDKLNEVCKILKSQKKIICKILMSIHLRA